MSLLNYVDDILSDIATEFSFLPGANVRNPAHGKGHEEGRLKKSKGVIRLQGEPLKFPEHPPPKRESACHTTLCFSSTLLTLTGDLSPHQLFLGKVNLEFLDNKSPGHNSVPIQTLLMAF